MEQPTISKKQNLVSDAVISDCKQYRYVLSRIWDETKPLIMFIMLNPSTADADKDDPTIRRCIRFAKSWGYGGLYVCNLFAYRASKPAELLKAHNPWGDQNIWHTRQLSDKVSAIVCAWGNKPTLKKLLNGTSAFALIDFAVRLNCVKLHYIALSKDGIPMHPLYLKSDLTLTRFEWSFIKKELGIK